jgi:hypothetical protein
MIYHGVRTESAVLMRMNYAPRTVAENLGSALEEVVRTTGAPKNVVTARQFLQRLDVSGWDAVAPRGGPMSGADYQAVWQQLSGESTSPM